MRLLRRLTVRRNERRFGVADPALADASALDALVAEIAGELADRGLAPLADGLTAVRSTAYTTGTEWLGELDAALRNVRRSAALSTMIRQKVERALWNVRRALCRR